jgi:hypothetical protein
MCQPVGLTPLPIWTSGNLVSATDPPNRIDLDTKMGRPTRDSLMEGPSSMAMPWGHLEPRASVCHNSRATALVLTLICIYPIEFYFTKKGGGDTTQEKKSL